MLKKKQTYLLIILGLTMLLVLLLWKDWGNGKHYSNHILSDEEFDAVKAVRHMADSNMVSTLIFDDEALIFDEEDHIFYYSVMKRSEDAFDPKIKIVSQDGRVNLAFREKQLTNELISKNEVIDFIIYSDDSYAQYQLKCTTLPMMNIHFEGDITEENTAMSMQLIDNREKSSQRLISSDGLIHIRGGSTKSYPKLGYKITLTENLSNGNVKKNRCELLGMRQDDDWILYAAYNDQEKIRNVFSSNLWTETCGVDNSFNIENGMRYEYIELFLNGRYWGLYALGYPIDDMQLSTKENKRECIYKKVQWSSECPIPYAEDGTITGYRIASSEKTDWTLLYELYEKLNDSETSDEWFYSSIDVENAIDYIWFINLIQGIDNVSNDATKNMYLTVKKWKDGTYKFLYTPWDLDITWGNSWGAEAWNLTNPNALSPSYNNVMESGSLYRLLMNHDENAWMRYLNKYVELRSDLWSDDSIMHMLDEYEKQIFDSGAYVRDMDRWPEGSYEDPKKKLSAFKQYVLDRLKELDEYHARVSNVKNENEYIIRSAQYKDFMNSNFAIRIDKTDKDFMELLEYIGICIDEIPEESNFLFYNAKERKINYRNNLGKPGDLFETCIGTVELKIDDDMSYESEEQCSVYIDGIRAFTYNWVEDETMRILFQKEKNAGFISMWLGN